MFEYLVINCTGNIIPADQLNQLGKEGWELITVANFAGYLKRKPKKKVVKRANK